MRETDRQTERERQKERERGVSILKRYLPVKFYCRSSATEQRTFRHKKPKPSNKCPRPVGGANNMMTDSPAES